MILPPVDRTRAREIVARFAGLNILVAGDVMLDRFIVGRVTRISPEAPVPVVRYETEHVRLGGAANVAHNIAALGGRPTLVGVVGDDQAARTLGHLLAGAGISDSGLVVDRLRPSTEKVRIVTERNQQVARIDYESDCELPGPVEEDAIDRITRAAGASRALLVSDYLKGGVTQRIVDALRSASASKSVPLVVDPKIPHLSFYSGATLVTPNHHEAEIATHRRIRTDDEARDAARDFRKRAGCGAVLVTRGEHGMWLADGTIEGAVPSVAREVSDVTGAGDTVVATLALALGAGATMAEAAVLANRAAGVVVAKFGPATLSSEELLQSIA